MDTSDYEVFLKTHPGRGKLRVQVTEARGAFPVPGAPVEVRRRFGGESRLLYKVLTDSSGIVENLVLPTLPAELSRQEATADSGGTAYLVAVSHPAFRTPAETAVMLYDGIETILPVALQPLAR